MSWSKIKEIFSKQREKKELMVPVWVVGLVLWLMVWGGYNARIWRLSDPKNVWDLFHGLRAGLPVLAAYMAGIVLLARQPVSVNIFQGPVGLLFLYNLIGLVSSLFLSAQPLKALYWGFQYGAVLLIVWAVSARSEPLNLVSRLISFNWVVAGALATLLFIFYLSQPGVVSSLVHLEFWGKRPYEESAAEGEKILGMAGTRPTGLGKYAGVVAIISLVRLSFRRYRSRALWLLFFFFIFVLFFSQGRGAILGFMFSALMIFYFRIKQKGILVLGLICFFLLLIFFGVHELVYGFLAENMGFDLTLGGRTVGVWPKAWNLFLKSPLIGWGFHADRIFLEGEHTHNAPLHALVQSGILGTIPFLFSFIWVWLLLFRFFKKPSILKTEAPLLTEAAGILSFFTISGVTQSTGAFFGTDLIFLVPLFCYLQVLNQKAQTGTLYND